MSFKARTLAHKKLREQKLRDQKKLAALPSPAFGAPPPAAPTFAAPLARGACGTPEAALLSAGESVGEGDAVALEARAFGEGPATRAQLDVEAPQ